MISKADIKYIRSLRQKKYRQKHEAFVVEGEKMVAELMASNLELIKGFSVGIHPHFQSISERELESISQLSTPNQLLAVARIPQVELDWDKFKNKLVIALDGVKDPGNLGTIIRIADWFGVEDLICSVDTVDAYNSKVVQASMGSIFRVRLHYLSLNQFVKDYEQQFSSQPMYAANMQGENAFETTLKNGLLIMGSESHGLSAEVLQKTTSITIPRYGSAESLNVAVATGILCAQFSKS